MVDHFNYLILRACIEGFTKIALDRHMLVLAVYYLSLIWSTLEL